MTKECEHDIITVVKSQKVLMLFCAHNADVVDEGCAGMKEDRRCMRWYNIADKVGDKRDGAFIESAKNDKCKRQMEIKV